MSKSQIKGNRTTVDWRPSSDFLKTLRTPPNYSPDPKDIEIFEKDGVALIPGIFKEWVNELKKGLKRHMDNPSDYAFPCDSIGPNSGGRFFDSYCNWHLIPEYTCVITDSVAAAMACAFMNSDHAQLFHEHVFCKDPGTRKATPWHHDLPYYCVDGRKNATIYISLDSAKKDTAVRFIAGSHKSNDLYFPRRFADGSDYVQSDPNMTSVPKSAIKPDNESIRTFNLEPGDALIFDFRTLHGTTDAPIIKKRRAFSTRWLGDDMVYCERSGETSPPLKDLGVSPGMAMPETLFPILWKK